MQTEFSSKPKLRVLACFEKMFTAKAQRTQGVQIRGIIKSDKSKFRQLFHPLHHPTTKTREIMNKISFIVLFVLALSTNVKAQSCNQKAPPADVQKMHALLGEWKGEFVDNAKTYSLSIKFYEANNELKLKITNAALVPGNSIADASLCSTDKFHFFGRRIDGEVFRYNARLKNGELVGDYAIGESCAKDGRPAFKLKKVVTDVSAESTKD
jgi:hypothetical protein